MKYELAVLGSGLKVMVMPMATLESATLTLWVKTGSRAEDKRTNGLSHFLEHMVFKGSKKRPTAKEISEAVDSMGGEFNAATSKDWTNFYIKTRAGNLEKAFDVLSDMVLDPILSLEEIEREKGVILEEIAMHEDTPMLKIWDVFEELIFRGHPLSWDTSGTPESVKGIKKEDFLLYQKAHYYPEKMLVSVAGGVKPEEVFKLVQKYLGELKAGAKERLAEFSSSQKKPQISLYSQKKEQAHLVLGFRGEGRGYKGRFAELILSTILGRGMSSRLFIEVRERRGLAYAISSNIERYMETGYLATYAGVDLKKVREAISVILEEHYAISDSRKRISESEIRKAKEFIKGHLALALEDTKDVNSFFGEPALFLQKIETPEEVYRKVDRVSVEEVLTEAKKLFVPQRLNLAVIGPYKSKERFEKLIY